MYQRPLSIAILALGGFAAAYDARALGFGRTPDSIPFGQSLDLSVPMRVDAGESLVPGCLHAEVQVGELRMPLGAVVVTLERRGETRDELRVRIRSAVVVQEPLVAVNLSVGCNGSVSRQFVVFADPAEGIDASRLATADVSPPTAMPASQSSSTAAVPQPVPHPQRPAAASGGFGRVPAFPPRLATNRPARKTQADASHPQNQVKAGASLVAARSEAPQHSIPTDAPRLKLEEPEALLRAATRAVAAQDAALASAALTASVAQAAASAAEQRLVALESDLKTVRDEAAAHRAALDQTRTRLLSQAEDQGRMQSALAAFVVGLGALALWLGWRVRSLQRERQAAWWRDAPKAAVADEPAAADEALVGPPGSAAATPWAQAVPNARLIEEASPSAQRTSVLPPSARVEDALTRPASVDELIDLEQQAEFFVVLGEEDAAVDLLMSHLRSTGGTSPLPYLKLLEIYRRRGGREAYERMRKRFSQRFNALAPDWGADPEQGRDLQDYPAVLAALQVCWNQPLDAMAELENLLFRKRSGELFELPAYRDVLTLYSVARDLQRLADQPTPDVDVLLPLATGDGLTLTAPQSIFDSLSPGNAEADSVLEDRPTAPVDLDLSEPPTLHDSRAGELPLRLTLHLGY